jgi:hypothetical protein
MDFENWERTDFYEDPEDYITTNINTLFGTAPLSIYHVDGENDEALRLTAFNNGRNSWSGMITNDDVEGGYIGGIPYQGQPTMVNISYRAFIPPGDTATIELTFKKGGQIINQVFIPITENRMDYEESAYSIPMFNEAPDSMVLYIRASVTDVLNPGSSLDVDHIVFDSGNQIENHLFNNWEYVGFENPEGWTSLNAFNSIFKRDLFVERTDDAYSGEYAVSVSTRYEQFFEDEITGYMLLTTANEDADYQAIDVWPNSISGFYKYESEMPDTALIYLEFIGTNPQTGNEEVLGPFILLLNEQDDYTEFTMLLDIPYRPDSVAMAVVADYGQVYGGSVDLGRKLTLDALSMDIVLNTSLNHQFDIQVYPNPTLDRVIISGLDGENVADKIEILDGFGRLVGHQVNHGVKEVEVDLRAYPEGIYLIGVLIDNQKYYTRVIRE